jgi:hypothetical protein
MFILFNYRFDYHRQIVYFQCLFKKKTKSTVVFSWYCLFIMVDTITVIAMGNDHDDWEVAVDTGEFDKRLEQQEKDRAATQVIFFVCRFLFSVLKVTGKLLYYEHHQAY